MRRVADGDDPQREVLELAAAAAQTTKRFSSSRVRAGVVVLFVAVSTCATAAAGAPLATPVVARWARCELFNERSHNATHEKYAKLVSTYGGSHEARAATSCRPIFCGGYMQYEADRCWAPRAFCALTPDAQWSSVATGGEDDAATTTAAPPPTAPTLITSSAPSSVATHPPGAELRAGSYVVFFGAANAMGQLVVDPLDEQLERAGVTVANLGKGAASPGLYLEQWAAIEPIVAGAAAVVVHAMSIRASENDFCPVSKCLAVERYEAWVAATRTDPEKARAMEAQSFDNAINEYAELLRRIDAAGAAHRAPWGSSSSSSSVVSPSAVVQHAFPKKFLLWQSRCDPTRACEDGSFFPQWFTSRARIDALFGLDGWDGVFDASYADADEFASTLTIDKCVESNDAAAANAAAAAASSIDACGAAYAADAGDVASKPTRTHTCHHEHARADIDASGDGCSTKCAFVRQSYYPIDVSHNKSFAVLLPALREAIADYHFP